MTNPATPIGRMMIKDARLAFPKLFTAEAMPGSDTPNFGASLILPPDHPQLAAIKATMLAVAKDKWKDKAQGFYTQLEKTDKLALHDGDTKAQYDGFPGNFFIATNAKADCRPTVIDGNRNPVAESDGIVYAGCYVNASIDFWAQDNKFGKRINAQIRGVQFYRRGDAFSAGRPADSDEFEPVTDGATADDFA